MQDITMTVHDMTIDVVQQIASIIKINMSKAEKVIPANVFIVSMITAMKFHTNALER